MTSNDPAIEALIEKFGYKLTDSRRTLLQNAVNARTRHFTFVLEDLKDQHNISAIIRTSEVFGFQDVHIIEELNSYQISRAILKGSYKWMDIYRYKKRINCLKHLKSRGYRIAVASTAAEESLYEMDFSEPTAFYMGSETMGNHADTLAAADCRFRIPQHGLTESMNVSVCAGVIMAALNGWLAKEGRERYALNGEERAELLATFFERSAVGVDQNSPLHFMD